MNDKAMNTLQPKSLRPITAQQNKRTEQQNNRTAHEHNKSALAIAISAAVMSSLSMAESKPASEEETFELETIQIEERTIDTNPYAQPGSPYKARISGDARHVKPLAETPQTISVITQAQIQESGATDLREILDAQPGITLGTGENGNAFGDRYIIRGHEARSDVFVDSLRDPGMTIRESFATEQVEVTKGPNSTFAGRGSSGGAINSISKMASTEYNFAKGQAGVGNDKYYRTTLDTNLTLNENLAVRANLLEAYEQVPDRDPADRNRAGAALSGLVKPTGKLTLIGDYYYLNAKDMPDLGTYITPKDKGGKPVDDLPVYSQKSDFLESEVEVFTFRQHLDFNDNVNLKNAMRYGTTDNGYVTTGARGNVRNASDPAAPGTDTVSLSTHQGWQEVDYFVDQANLYVDAEIANMKHQLIFGAEYSDMKVLNGVYKITNMGSPNCRVGATGPGRDGYCIDINGATLPNIDGLMNRKMYKGLWDSDYQINTLALSVMDTIDLTDHWMLSLGVRLDDFDYTNSVATGATRVITDYEYDDALWNYQAGITYKINQQGNVYFNYSTSSEINGGESDLGSNCGYGGLCGTAVQVGLSEPEAVENLELGTKWNVLNEKLLFTAAVFQITKDDVMESVGNAYSSLGTLNTGSNRVEGFEVSLTGNVTEDLSVQIGATTMESKVLESFDKPSEGRVLSNFADDSVFMQVRYQATPAFAFGGTARYSSEMYTGQPDSGASWNIIYNDYSYEVPAYETYDLFASYDINEKASVLLNIGNVLDEDYYLAGYRSGAFTYKGDERSAKLTLTYDF